MKICRVFGTREYTSWGRAYAACRRMGRDIEARVGHEIRRLRLRDGSIRAIPVCSFFDYAGKR